MTQARQQKSAVTLRRNGLTVECFFGENGRLSRKIERYDRQFAEYAYAFDAKGHLVKVRRDGTVTEQYQYNPSGRRVEQKREYRGFSDSTNGMLRYDEAGRLVRAGDATFYYDKRGALSERCDCQGVTKYFYGNDTLPDKVVLPSRAEIRYEYDQSNPVNPVRRFRSGNLTTEFVWLDPLHLAAYRDHDTLLEYAFQYDNAGILTKVRIDTFKPEKQQTGAGTDWLGSMVTQKRRERLHDFLGRRALPLTLLCGCDQVGTLKILTDTSGRLVSSCRTGCAAPPCPRRSDGANTERAKCAGSREPRFPAGYKPALPPGATASGPTGSRPRASSIKEIVRDSFGVQQSDSFPDLFMPVGFAGGLTDPETGLVRFGYRDYDPAVGRFTAPDPIGDTGGDHDLYDYCIDDPVTMNDPGGFSFGLLSAL